jgi:hypothetical protein
MGKALTVIGVVFMLFCMGTCAYFVAGVSSTFPPIRQYKYTRSFNQLKQGLDNLSLVNKNMFYKITDTTGDEKTGHNYYVDIKLINHSDTILYNIVYQSTDYFFKKNITEIGVVGAFDIPHSQGGYGYGDGKNGVKELVLKFEKDVLVPLYRGQTILIVPPN